MSDQALVAQQPMAVFTVETKAGPNLVVATQQIAVFVAAAGQGAAGRDGRDGTGGGGAGYVFTQDQPLATWNIHHLLGGFPSVSLVDSTGDEFDAAVRYIDANNIAVMMVSPTSGKAFLN